MIPISKPYIGEAEKQAVMEVLESGMLAQGPRTAKLEEQFAAGVRRQSTPSPPPPARRRCTSRCWRTASARATK